MNSLYYGRQIAEEILKSPLKATKLLLAEGIEAEFKEAILRLAKQKRIPVQNVPVRYLDNRIRGNHQGVAVEAPPIQPVEFKSFIHSLPSNFKGYVCILDEIQDPQNLGALLRSAVCFDCSAVIVPTHRSSPLSETVMRASSGAMAHCPIIEIANLGVAVERLKERGFSVLGADSSAPIHLGEEKYPFPVAILLGNEHRGVKPTLKKNCDQLLSIRHSPKFDSLNVSCAATVFFNTIYNQMRSQ